MASFVIVCSQVSMTSEQLLPQKPTIWNECIMNEEHASGEAPQQPTVPSQTEIYDSLRRIGELEDQKQTIQQEIETRTEQLRQAVKHVAADSLLHKILTSALGKSETPTKRRVKKPARSPAKKKAARKGGRKR